MNASRSVEIPLGFGAAEPFLCNVSADVLVDSPQTPLPLADVGSAVQAALQQPLEFPPFRQVFVPGDRIVLAVDPETPCLAEILRGLWSELAAIAIEPQQVTILQHRAESEASSRDLLRLTELRTAFPVDVREQIQWRFHTPGAEDDCRYLASTLGGQRIYLAEDLVMADVVVTVGHVAFDSLLGYRGTNSLLYPGLSTAEAVRKTQGLGHRELQPDDVRPLRQLVDEIAWLLGTQFTIQAVPAAEGGVAAVLAGGYDAVFRAGIELLNQHWRTQRDFRVETVLLAIDDPHCSWDTLGRTLETGRNLVSQDGRIVIVCGLSTPPEMGMELLMRADEPAEALRPLRELNPPDLCPATQLADALAWARIALFSRLPAEIVEDLGMLPIDDVSEVERLIARQDQVLILPAAQHRHASISSR